MFPPWLPLPPSLETTGKESKGKKSSFLKELELNLLPVAF